MQNPKQTFIFSQKLKRQSVKLQGGTNLKFTTRSKAPPPFGGAFLIKVLPPKNL